MIPRVLAMLALVASAPAAHATMVPIPVSFPVPGLGFLGVAATGVVAVLIGWWRMRK